MSKNNAVENPPVSVSLNWLSLNDGPWSTILDKWESSFDLREHQMFKPQTEIKLKKIKVWKHIETEFGYQLVCRLYSKTFNAVYAIHAYFAFFLILD